MISLSVYGDPGNPLYAAVWFQRQGPAWVAVHGVDSTGYQSFFNTWTAKGFVPVLVSATGTISNAIFAAVFEQGIAGPWFAQHGMTSGDATTAGTFQYANAAAAAGSQILRSVAIYGTAADRRYAAVWHPNPVYVKWHVHPSDTGGKLPGGFQCGNAVARISPGRISPGLRSSFRRRDVLFRVQGRFCRSLGGAAWNDGIGLPERIQPASGQRLLPDLYPGRGHYKRRRSMRRSSPNRIFHRAANGP